MIERLTRSAWRTCEPDKPALGIEQGFNSGDACRVLWAAPDAQRSRGELPIGDIPQGAHLPSRTVIAVIRAIARYRRPCNPPCRRRVADQRAADCRRALGRNAGPAEANWTLPFDGSADGPYRCGRSPSNHVGGCSSDTPLYSGHGGHQLADHPLWAGSGSPISLGQGGRAVTALRARATPVGARRPRFPALGQFRQTARRTCRAARTRSADGAQPLQHHHGREPGVLGGHHGANGSVASAGDS